VSTMIRFIVLGGVVAAVGGITKLIWPDDWVYSSVSDERGIRSIRRRRGAPEAEPPVQQQPQQLQPAAIAPGYGGYPQPYPGYPPQQWGQPYPGQYPPGYAAPYPAGPYAQPAQPLPQHYTSPGKPTVPVMPVQVEQGAAGELIPPAAPPLDARPGDLPADAAGVVPRVVATTETTLDAARSHASQSKASQSKASESKAPESHAPEPHTSSGGAKATFVDAATADEPDDADAPDDVDADDDDAGDGGTWSGEKDW
jgi:hypothetical protein